MQNDLVERVARAMWERAHWGPWLEATPYEREPYLKGASAAFCAIEAAGYVVVPREPTDMMLQAGYYASPDDAQGTWYVDELGTWRAMIDAALKKETVSNE